METNQIVTSQNKDQVSDEMMKTIEVYTESQDEFPMYFDEFWQWCGYARKDNAKRVLENNFIQLTGYQVFHPNTKNPKGRKPSQIILHKLVDNKPISKNNPQLINLTTGYTKAFAMLAQTSKGRVSSLLSKSREINATKVGEALLLFEMEGKKKLRYLIATRSKEASGYITESQTLNHLPFQTADGDQKTSWMAKIDAINVLLLSYITESQTFNHLPFQTADGDQKTPWMAKIDAFNVLLLVYITESQTLNHLPFQAADGDLRNTNNQYSVTLTFFLMITIFMKSHVRRYDFNG